MSYGQILQSRMLQCTLQNKKRAAEKQEEALFKESPPPEDCPICFLPCLKIHSILLSNLAAANSSAMDVSMQLIKKHTGGGKLASVHSVGNRLLPQTKAKPNV